MHEAGHAIEKPRPQKIELDEADEWREQQLH
jgi:hypothetical protein